MENNFSEVVYDNFNNTLRKDNANSQYDAKSSYTGYDGKSSYAGHDTQSYNTSFFSGQSRKPNQSYGNKSYGNQSYGNQSYGNNQGAKKNKGEMKQIGVGQSESRDVSSIGTRNDGMSLFSGI